MRIGVMDSGVGGLSVWKELIQLIPGADYIYVADSGYCPYGERTPEYIQGRCVKIIDYLLSEGVSLVVVACNTATAAAIDMLRRKYPVPIVGMEPATKPAALASRSGVIGVLATKGTFGGSRYINTLNMFAKDVRVLEQVGTGLVELVETGQEHSPKAYSLLSRYLLPMVEQGADHIVLGCTHYPFLTRAIEEITEGKVALVNPAPAVAQRVKYLLDEADGGGKGVAGASACYGAQESVIIGSDTFISTADNIDVLNRMTLSIVTSIPGCFRRMSYRQMNL